MRMRPWTWGSTVSPDATPPTVRTTPTPLPCMRTAVGQSTTVTLPALSASRVSWASSSEVARKNRTKRKADGKARAYERRIAAMKTIPQDPALEERTCKSKLHYASREEAERVARRYGWSNVKPYQCPFCFGWHLTSRER